MCQEEEVEAALNRLFEFLMRRQMISEIDSVAKTEIAQIAEEFGSYLREQRGLADEDCDRVPKVRSSLSKRFVGK